MDLKEDRLRIIFLLVLVITSVIFMLLDSIGAISFLYDGVSYVSVPVREQARKFTIKANDFFGVISKINDIEKENAMLRDQNAKLYESISKLDELKIQNNTLREQLGMKEDLREGIIKARIIGIDLTLENALQVNVGKNDGVKEGNILVWGEYALGVVERVSSRSSKVLTVLSPELKIPARGQKNRAKGLVQGDIGARMNMIDILPDETIKNNEIVITSGLDSDFPAGLILGFVTNVRKNTAQATQEAELETPLDFNDLDYVYLIQGQK